MVEKRRFTNITRICFKKLIIIHVKMDWFRWLIFFFGGGETILIESGVDDRRRQVDQGFVNAQADAWPRTRRFGIILDTDEGTEKKKRTPLRVCPL